MYYIITKRYALRSFSQKSIIWLDKQNNIYSVLEPLKVLRDGNIKLSEAVDGEKILHVNGLSWVRLRPIEGSWWLYEDGSKAKITNVTRRHNLDVILCYRDSRLKTEATEYLFRKWKLLEDN